MTRATRALVLAGYVVVFWCLLPWGLWSWGRALDARLRWGAPPRPLGWPILALGLALLLASTVALWREGRGLPVGALPPVRLARHGPYRFMRHPIYLAFNIGILGAGLVLGSPGLAFVVAPAFAPLWIAYAHWEERGLLARFGRAYGRYRRRVGLLPGPNLYDAGWLLAQALPVQAEGLDHVPREGPAVLVANHCCYLDPFFLGAVTPRRIHFLVTAESLRRPPLSVFMRRADTIPLRRYRSDPAACREMRRLLEEGEVVGVFVEGERSPLGAYQGAQPRVADLVTRLGVPIVPAGICGSYDFGPRWADVLRRRPVRVRFGPKVAGPMGKPAQAIDCALRALLDEDPQPVHLAGLPLSRLSRVLWRCPACLDQGGWSAEKLACLRCGTRYVGTPAGRLRTPTGEEVPLAELGWLVGSVPEREPIVMRALGAWERDIVGEIRPLEPLGVGSLTIDHERIRFGDLDLPLTAVRSVTTERADTLQIATNDAMWQFRPLEGSVFRLHAALAGWRRDHTADEAGSWVARTLAGGAR